MDRTSYASSFNSVIKGGITEFKKEKEKKLNQLVAAYEKPNNTEGNDWAFGQLDAEY